MCISFDDEFYSRLKFPWNEQSMKQIKLSNDSATAEEVIFWSTQISLLELPPVYPNWKYHSYFSFHLHPYLGVYSSLNFNLSIMIYISQNSNTSE